ncbi:hypothetical protein CFAM422_012067 [Trichoderma lentiforme]|uniref:Uncharacterized protein n=1 Tax=Trichoderma lentiforme TaxID=1567552 RepID=A0A9P4X5A3_9HYPO|nr:hypothetical protein CFAM422_012067 [Trichoderma lentiforme]
MFERERVPNSAGRKKKRTKSPANATGGNGPWGDEALIQSYSLPNLFLQGSHSAIQVAASSSPATRGPEPPRYRRYRALPEDCDSSAVLPAPLFPMHTFYQLGLQQQLLQTTPDTSGEFHRLCRRARSCICPEFGLPIRPRPLDSHLIPPPSWLCPAPSFTAAFSPPNPSRLRASRSSSTLVGSLVPSPSQASPSERRRSRQSSSPPNPPPRQPGADQEAGAYRIAWMSWLSAGDEIARPPTKRFSCLKLLALSDQGKIRTHVPSPTLSTGL